MATLTIAELISFVKENCLQTSISSISETSVSKKPTKFFKIFGEF